MKKSLLLIFVLIVVGWVLTSQKFTITRVAAFTEKNVPPANPEANYKNYCAGCHGEKMDAFVDRNWKHGKTGDALFKGIKFGYHNEGMPGFDSAFTDMEITELSTYILKGIENVNKYNYTREKKSNILEAGALRIRLDTVVTGVNVPWGLAFLPGGDMLVTDRSGKLFRVGSNRSLQQLQGVPEVLAAGQGGLLDVALHPDFKNNQLIYLSYSKSKKEGNNVLATTAVTRAKLSGNTLTQQQVIFEALPYASTRHHYGSRLVFDKKGLLYVSVGDRGNEKVYPQNLNNYNGKVHRIRDDGRVPADNPFVNREGATPSIYSYGHRNIQGMTVHPASGKIWSHEHGPRGGDEVNISEKGKNYGWPAISYGINYDGTVLTKNTAAAGMEQPLLYWLPSIGPSGMAFVTSDKYKDWKGNLLVGSLRFNYIELCKVKGDKIKGKEMILKNIGRVRDVRMGPDGFVYVSVENPGAVLRLMPVK